MLSNQEHINYNPRCFWKNVPYFNVTNLLIHALVSIWMNWLNIFTNIIVLVLFSQLKNNEYITDNMDMKQKIEHNKEKLDLVNTNDTDADYLNKELEWEADLSESTMKKNELDDESWFEIFVINKDMLKIWRGGYKRKRTKIDFYLNTIPLRIY